MSDNKIAESLYKTSVGRIKVLEKQVEILINYLGNRTSRCPYDEQFKTGYTTYNGCCLNNDCLHCWREWSLKQAEKELIHNLYDNK